MRNFANGGRNTADLTKVGGRGGMWRGEVAMRQHVFMGPSEERTANEFSRANMGWGRSLRKLELCLKKA